MDDGYEQLVGTLTLNHDRYKTYFAQFIALHFGLFAAMGTQFYNLRIFLSLIGLVVCVVWIIVQWRIRQDIIGTWDAIRIYEKDAARLKVKLSEVKRGRIPASSAMLAIPPIFGLVYSGIIFTALC